MTRVDFYLLNDSEDGKHIAVCKLVHKAFRLGHRIFVHTENTDEAERLDQLLWTFAAGSFIPHRLAQDGAADVPVTIGHDQPPAGFEDVLISLTPDVPAFYSRFQRVADVVGNADDEKQRARERFRYYRQQGCEPQTHNL